MTYSCSAVRLRCGAGATTGGVVGCAGTTTADEHSAINIATQTTTSRVVNFMKKAPILTAFNLPIYREETRRAPRRFRAACPLYPRKRTLVERVGMSAL